MVGLVWLDKHFNIEGEPQMLTINHIFPAGSYVQDPRMVVIRDKLYFVYSNLWKLPNKEIRRMFVA